MTDLMWGLLPLDSLALPSKELAKAIQWVCDSYFEITDHLNNTNANDLIVIHRERGAYFIATQTIILASEYQQTLQTFDLKWLPRWEYDEKHQTNKSQIK